MFEGNETSRPEIHLPVNDEAVYDFLNVINKPAHSLSWRETIQLITYFKPYGCDSFIRDLLYKTALQNPEGYRLDALVLMCEADHLLGACRLLRRAGSAEGKVRDGPSLRPNSSDWTPAQAARLSPQWNWALGCAIQMAEAIAVGDKYKGEEERSGDKYWIVVVGEFVSRLTMRQSSP